MNIPLVSVLMTYHNSEKYIAESIQSALMQTHSNLQLVLVDDGSTDCSVKIAKSFQDSRIEHYSLPENRHIPYALNFALEKVKGDYVAILDSDDIWEKEKLEKQIDYLTAHPEHKGCFTWVNLIDETGQIVNEKLSQLRELYDSHTDTREDWLRFFFFYGNRLNNPSSLIVADTIKEIGMHNLFYVQAMDFEWWVRFTKKFSFGIIEERLVRYRRTLESISSATEIHDIAFYNQYMMIRYHFFDDMDDELFIRTFQPCFYCKDSYTPEELACEKALLMVNSMNGSKVPCAAGLAQLESLMGNPNTAALLKEKYHFSTHECYERAKQHIFCDPFIDDISTKYLNSQNHVIALQEHIYHLEAALELERNRFRHLKKVCKGFKKFKNKIKR